jgi:predicted unusual protein kinase regulating ubiquinone biosynthesis (AarF/ABC1/UbiB family)
LFPRQDRAGLLAELRERLLEECDYVREADNQEEFRALYAQTPGVLIPRVHRAVSTDRILTMDFVKGQRFAAFVRDADQAAKDRAGETIFRVVSAGIFRHRLFNADPHPGNYLFPEGGGVAFVDFGCVKRFPRDLVRLWAHYQHAIVEGRREEVDRLVVQLGLVADPDKFDFAYHHESMTKLCEHFLSEVPFRFNKHFVANNWQKLIVENPNKAWSKMPAHLLFANRLQWGLHSVLAELGAQADWGAIHLEDTAICLNETAAEPAR